MPQATPGALKRLQREAKTMETAPPQFIRAKPDEGNILTWHYVLEGPPDTPYHGGYFLGKLQFPADYPFGPPSIFMTTPSGRFKVNTRLCLSISDFHPAEWNPVWNIGTILTGLLSFMVTADITYGSMQTSDNDKKKFTLQSHAFNRKDPIFTQYFLEGLNTEMREKEDSLRRGPEGGQDGSANQVEAANSVSGEGGKPPRPMIIRALVICGQFALVGLMWVLIAKLAKV